MKLIIVVVVALAVVTSAKQIWEGKRYKNYESVNFEAYLKEFGIGDAELEHTANVKPTIELQKLSNGKYKLIHSSSCTKVENTFELNKVFKWTNMEGMTVQGVITLNGNTMTQKLFSYDNHPSTTIVRVFGDKEMVATMTVNNVVCVRKYGVEH